MGYLTRPYADSTFHLLNTMYTPYTLTDSFTINIAACIRQFCFRNFHRRSSSHINMWVRVADLLTLFIKSWCLVFFRHQHEKKYLLRATYAQVRSFCDQFSAKPLYTRLLLTSHWPSPSVKLSTTRCLTHYAKFLVVGSMADFVYDSK